MESSWCWARTGWCTSVTQCTGTWPGTTWERACCNARTRWTKPLLRPCRRRSKQRNSSRACLRFKRWLTAWWTFPTWPRTWRLRWFTPRNSLERPEIKILIFDTDEARRCASARLKSMHLSLSELSLRASSFDLFVILNNQHLSSETLSFFKTWEVDMRKDKYVH